MDELGTGVYQIVNAKTGEFYIGSTTKSFKMRWQTHRSLLRCNKHCNKLLQKAWNEYGIENFKFEVLRECSPSQCEYYEQQLIDTEYPVYNIRTKVSRISRRSQGENLLKRQYFRTKKSTFKIEICTDPLNPRDHYRFRVRFGDELHAVGFICSFMLGQVWHTGHFYRLPTKPPWELQ